MGANALTPRVWNKHTGDAPSDAVYVGRPSRFGNPFSVTMYGRDECIEKFREWIHQPEQARLRLDAKWNLKGKDLVCWCAPEPCHADVLLELANSEE